MRRFALVGYGAITEELLGCIEGCGELNTLVAVLVRPQHLAEAQAKAAGRFEVLDNVGALVGLAPAVVAGIDGLLAARTAGLGEVTYTSIKPPAAWDGTPGERLLAGAARGKRTTFFEGSAREAATQYPQKVNVGATVALSGLGLDRTRVRLVSDPSATGPLGIIEAEGGFGRMRFEILAYASPRNPKTSLLTAHCLYAALREGVGMYRYQYTN